MDLKTGVVPDISEAYGGTLRVEPATHLKAVPTDDAALAASPSAADLPQVFSLVGLLPAAEDQARRGTCSTFAAMVAAQFVSGKDLSEQHAYNIAWQLENSGFQTGEATSLEAAFAALKQGVCEASIWPYYPEPAPGNIPQGPVPEAVRAAPKYTIGRWALLPLPTRGRAEYIAERLFAVRSPVILSVPTFWGGSCGWEEGFFIDVPPDDPPLGGWHAIAAVGYDLHARFAIFQNSWGQDWGIAGMGLMSFAYLERYVRGAYQVEG
jgi:hypothetical protein